jgi:C4-dicarboxylate transporter DctQ subunit
MNLLYEALPRPLRLACYLAGLGICLLFFAALAWTGALEVLDEIDLQATSESLEIPVWLYTVGTPALSALTMVRILQNAAETLRARKW